MIVQRDRDILRFIEDNKSITLQQSSILFFKCNYKSASRRLNQLEKEALINSYISKYNKQKAYYNEVKLSSHNLIILDIYAQLLNKNSKILKFIASFHEKNNLSFLNGLVKPDGYIEIEYKDYIFNFIIEIDYTHYTGGDKFKLYEKMYRDGEGKDVWGNNFPSILVLRPTDADYRYKSEIIDIIYCPMEFKNVNLDELLFS